MPVEGDSHRVVAHRLRDRLRDLAAEGIEEAEKIEIRTTADGAVMALTSKPVVVEGIEPDIRRAA